MAACLTWATGSQRPKCKALCQWCALEFVKHGSVMVYEPEQYVDSAENLETATLHVKILLQQNLAIQGKLSGLAM